MVTVEIAAYEEKRVGMGCYKLVNVDRKRCKWSHHCWEDGTTHIQEVVAEGKLWPKVLLGDWRYKSSTQTVRNLDVHCISATVTGFFKPVEPEETISWERERKSMTKMLGGED